ncbi:genetic interactor of prohibitins 3, mitochondrial [Podospora australis]|uniref:Genetic interactor of prohibitins 3, mitochondrial n=1 Tax=Podospora australis TaxID=1536484 RepID=A0AAN7AHA7_9PEZI|nr:genetic interactor of prohibitins 3, mitochondrial [Podospora australis]
MEKCTRQMQIHSATLGYFTTVINDTAMSVHHGRTICSRWIGRAFSLERKSSTSELPIYLCPAFRSLSRERATPRPQIRQAAPTQFRQLRRLHAQAAAEASEPVEDDHHEPVIQQKPVRQLPGQCSGCGALSQTAIPDQAGYFDISRKSVRQYLGLEDEKETRTRTRDQKDDIVKQALSGLNVEGLAQLGIDLTSLLPRRDVAPSKSQSASDKPPVCDRCHKLLHHSAGTSIYHPSVESLRDTIEESPYKQNHVYHVLDAADFPMSLIKGLPALLDVTLRTQNRRSSIVKYHRGRRMEMSFIITRSDLLAPKKEQVDAMMPYLKEVLRESLGRLGGRVRLGNVRCVSAKRHWWTSELKEEIFERGGAGWMVGRVNVGKSQLFEAVYPKNRMDPKKSKDGIQVNMFPKDLPLCKQELDESNPLLPGLELDNGSELLPPPQPEVQFPEMPIVSSLPGTTASPIRVPFGSGKGELIDLPGLSRGDLELHIRESCRQDLIMKSRIVPEQQVIRPGQSLLLGGFIRITPRNVAPDEELVFLGYAFTPIEPHLTDTNKAILVQTQSPDAPKVANISLPGTGEKIQHAGAFQLRYDITKQKTGPITRKEAAGIRVDRLPYRVLGIDILIEGCGWVELNVQVRTRKLFGDRKPEDKPKEEEKTLDDWESQWPSTSPEVPLETVPEKLDLRPEPVNAVKKKEDKNDPWAVFDDVKENEGPEPNWPVIDVFSPEGRFIGYRRPMCAWEVNKVKKTKEESKKRPRPSMKGVKKEVKRGNRGPEATF